MKKRIGLKTCALLLAMGIVPGAFAGWNHQSRRSCHVFAKYSASASAGYKGYNQMGDYVGSSGYVAHDTGCGYAHAGPLKYYGYNNFLLSEAESSIGSIGTVGYAHTWTQFDPISNLLKKGTADAAVEEKNVAAVDREKAPSGEKLPSVPIETASNLIVIAATTFNDAARAPKPAPPSVVLSGITGHLSAQAGYSTFEVIATLSKGEAPRPTDKVLWKGKAVVHDNRLTVFDGFAKDMFKPKAANPVTKEIVYTLNNVDLRIPLENDIDLESVIVTTKGDAGDATMLTARESAAVAANTTARPAVGVEAIMTVDTDKDGKPLTR